MSRLFATILKTEVLQDGEIEENEISAAEIFSILLESKTTRVFFKNTENMNNLIDKIDVS